MNKKKWTLIILIILLTAACIKLFYKTWNNKGVVRNADMVMAIDVKRITNTLLWQFITNPSQWKNIHVFPSSGEGKVEWTDMVSLPDYIFIFHVPGQPADALYTVMDINDKDDFEKGLQDYHFVKTITGSYLSKEAGVEIMQNGNTVLIGNGAVNSRQYMQQVAEELFTAKNYIDKDSLAAYVNMNSHVALSLSLFQHSFLEGRYFIAGNLEKEKISFVTTVSPAIKLDESVSSFAYCDSSLCSIGFVQPVPQWKQLFPRTAWDNLSKAVNFNIDSLLLQSNKKYQLDIAGIYPRIDSAVSVVYDDNFNPVEKKVVNLVEEPAFNFSVHGDSVNSIYHFWDNNGKLEPAGDSNLFTPVPFVRSCCRVKSNSLLEVTSCNYSIPAANKKIECIFFSRLLLTKLPPAVQGFIPPGISKVLENIESAELVAAKEKGQIVLSAKLNKKKNDRPIIEW